MSLIHRRDLKNGDLIGWRRPRTNGSDFWLNLVRFATISDFGHVSIVWNQGSEPSHVEAVQPRIRRAPITEGEAYVIPIGQVVTDEQMHQFFHDKLGLKYSFRDALMGYVGVIPDEDDRYQCAELSLEFYRSIGMKLPNAYTPSRLMRQVLRKTESSMYFLHE